MNKQLLLTTLKVALQGQCYNNYNADTQLSRIVKKVFAETRPDLVAKGYCVYVGRSDHKSKYFNIYLFNESWEYKKYILSYIKVSKTRDWRDDFYYKDFEIEDEIKVNEFIEIVKKERQTAKEKAQNDQDNAVELLLLIKNKYPLLSDYEIRQRIDYLYKNLYSIQKLLKQ